MIVKSHHVFIVMTILGLSACGGGSDKANSTPTINAIVVNAGKNITMNENESASLMGGSSGGSGAITYQWQATSSIQITHADTSVSNATIVAPTVTQLTEYTVSLVATDTLGAQQSDTILVSVSPINALPIAIVQATQIGEYAIDQFPVTAQIILDGTTSTDADPQTSGAAITHYEWQQIAGPNLFAGINSTQSIISLTAPILNEPQQAQIRLTVTDQEQATNSTDYSFTLLSQEQTILHVSASTIKSVFSGELVELSATATSLAPGASPFTALWSNNSSAQISDATSFNTIAASPLVTQDTMFLYNISATDSFRNNESAQISAEVFAPVTRVINDTGAINFANATNTSSHYQMEFPGQDASYGADRQTASGQIIKVGAGDQGFDFTRLDNNGDAIENSVDIFSCVRDNVTALVWQVKDGQNISSINYTEQQFTWYLEDENGNFAGELNTDSTTCNVQTKACNTQAYIDEVNTQGLCGFYDWRLPTPNELQSIIHYGKAIPPMVDRAFFPNLANAIKPQQWYWTSQTSADGVNEDIAYNAWAYDLQTGNDGFLIKSSKQQVMLVRAGR